MSMHLVNNSPFDLVLWLTGLWDGLSLVIFGQMSCACVQSINRCWPNWPSLSGHHTKHIFRPTTTLVRRLHHHAARYRLTEKEGEQKKIASLANLARASLCLDVNASPTTTTAKISSAEDRKVRFSPRRRMDGHRNQPPHHTTTNIMMIGRAVRGNPASTMQIAISEAMARVREVESNQIPMKLPIERRERSENCRVSLGTVDSLHSPNVHDHGLLRASHNRNMHSQPGWLVEDVLWSLSWTLFAFVLVPHCAVFFCMRPRKTCTTTTPRYVWECIVAWNKTWFRCMVVVTGFCLLFSMVN